MRSEYIILMIIIIFIIYRISNQKSLVLVEDPCMFERGLKCLSLLYQDDYTEKYMRIYLENYIKSPYNVYLLFHETTNI